MKKNIRACRLNEENLNIYDPYAPSVYGVGYMGNSTSKGNKLEHSRWVKMLSRCYNKNAVDYNRYGGIGVRVDPRWFSFENYLNDIKLLPNYDKKCNDTYNYQLDKDYLQMNIPKEQRVYSKDTCVLISPRDNANLKLIDNAKNKVNNYFGVYKSYNYYYPTIMHNGNKYNLGIYDNEIAAANAYNYFYRKLNSNIDSNVTTLNDVPYMEYEEFSKYAKRRASICPVQRLK